MRFARDLALALASAALIAGCGAAPRRVLPGDRISGSTLTIYSSGPMHGASSQNAADVLTGERLALAQAHNRIGRYNIVFKTLDDSVPQRGEWDPGQTENNARLAQNDPTTIGYLGDFNSGASAISIPLLNRLGIPQVSATNTAIGLTQGGPAAAPGEPDKYYPTGVRTYARVVPNDAVQAAAQVKLQKRLGCTRTFVLNDGEVDGQNSAIAFTLAAQQANLSLVGSQPFDARAKDYTALAASVAQTRPDCVLISAIPESNAVLLTKQIAAAVPAARLFAMAGLADPAFTDASQGGIPADLDSRLLITVATLDASQYPAAARAVLAIYAGRYGAPQPYAIFGYEAMSLLLNAIERATDHGRRTARRSKVVSALFAMRKRHSVLGTYSITHTGDSTLRRYGVYRVLNGTLTFVTAIQA